MTESANSQPVESSSFSRRTLLGAAAVAGGAGLVGLPGITRAAPAMPGFPEDLAATIPGLTYISLDAFAFDVAGTSPTAYRIYQDIAGTQPEPAERYINAALPLPIGSTIRQINVGYIGTPIVSVLRRSLDGTRSDLVTPTPLADGGGVKTQSLTVDASLTDGASYSVRAYCAAGDSIMGMTVGYVPPPQSFVPTTAADPRALDTRPASGLAPDEEVIVDLSAFLAPGARAAVFNLTATETGGPGFLAAFPDGTAWPGNSSVNFTGAGQTIANGVISTVGAGKVTIRTGPAFSHVIIDVIGSML